MFNEIYIYSIQPYMMFWTGMFGIMALLSIGSLIFGDFLDLDLDGDADLDIDGVSHGFMNSILSFFDLGHVPLTFLLFTFSSVNWGLGIILNRAINSGHSQSFGALLLIPVFIGAFFVTKLLNIPIKKLYKAMNGDNEVKNKIIGNICNTTTIINSKTGQAVITTGTSPLKIMVYCDDKTVEKNKTAVVLEFNKSMSRYLISEIESDDIFKTNK
jgi:hypothetical protein